MCKKISFSLLFLIVILGIVAIIFKNDVFEYFNKFTNETKSSNDSWLNITFFPLSKINLNYFKGEY